MEQLDYIASLGVNALQPLPPTQDKHFDSACWGDDPISLHAPDCQYGTPQDLKVFVNEAHKRGIAVLLDWVPNHMSAAAYVLALGVIV